MFERIEFVPFQAGDSRALWQIRNHESVRRFMSRQEPIEYARHEAWVRRHLVEEQTDEVYFIRLNGEPRGFVLVRDRAGRRAEFGIMLAPGAPRGLGAIATVLFLDHAFQALGLDELCAKIVRHNVNSIHGSLGLGAREVDCDDPRHRHFVFDRRRCLSAPRFVRLLERYGDRCEIHARYAVRHDA